ncbi:OLC1v1032319C1 [Oldenlandia corymbosa var. corymbosa]|uniref:OLC1v1032319C1 n=1 Tax=Oldenlandia corymbosa var. corymbosa TaxID=529605 RepID=A0AAV1CM61_OLDCO|nr:OLC1v1032319C1 [Oldenlandia corymbosa var. corymbosa]
MAPNFHSFLNSIERHCRTKEKTKKVEVVTSSSGSPSIGRGRGRMMNAMDEDDFEDAVSTGTPLSAIAEAFEDLSDLVKSRGGMKFDMDLKSLCDASSLVSVLFGCLGIAFKFAEMEYIAKLRDLEDASETYGTLSNIIDTDLETHTVKSPGSLSRKLRRVRQGLDLVRAIFQNFLSPEFCSLKEAASVAYGKVCAPYHTWPVRTAVSAGMCALPTRDQLLERLNETDESAEKAMRRYIKASSPVIEYIDMLYTSRNISLDW